MNLQKMIVTNSRCFRIGGKINPKGIMIHSVGTPQPDPRVFQRIWNRPDADASVHAVLGADGLVIQCLPWNYRGWHAGASGNDTHIGVEMSEPDTIKYNGGSNWIELNATKTKAHVLGTYKTAVELFSYICLMEGFDPLQRGVIVSHAEGFKMGIATNHGDVEHLWNKFGLTMTKFRRDIRDHMDGKIEKAKVEAKVEEVKITTIEGSVKVIYEGSDGLNVRTSPKIMIGNISQVVKKNEVFTVIGEVGDFYKIKSGLFITKNPKFVEFKKGPEESKVRITADSLNIRSGAGITTPIVGKVKKGEVFTIIEVKNGWGRLKSGAGWISLDFIDKV